MRTTQYSETYRQAAQAVGNSDRCNTFSTEEDAGWNATGSNPGVTFLSGPTGEPVTGGTSTVIGICHDETDCVTLGHELGHVLQAFDLADQGVIDGPGVWTNEFQHNEEHTEFLNQMGDELSFAGEQPNKPDCGG